MTRSNPIIREFVDQDAFGPEDKFDTSGRDFQLAIALSDVNGKILTNSRYIKYLVRLYKQQGQTVDVKHYPMHPCTSEDFHKFYPIEDRSIAAVE